MHSKLNVRLALRITRIYKKGQLLLRLEFCRECYHYFFALVISLSNLNQPTLKDLIDRSKSL